jgi:hypothetical protein
MSTGNIAVSESAEITSRRVSVADPIKFPISPIMPLQRTGDSLRVTTNQLPKKKKLKKPIPALRGQYVGQWLSHHIK